MTGLAPWSRDGFWCPLGPHCIECHSHQRGEIVQFGVDHTRTNMQGPIGLFVCRACALKFFYPDFIPSLFDFVYGGL